MKPRRDSQSLSSRFLPTKSSGTRPIAREEPDEDPEVTFDEDTLPRQHTVVLYQQLLHVFDSLSPSDREQFVIIASAFAALEDDERRALVTLFERMAKLA